MAETMAQWAERQATEREARARQESRTEARTEGRVEQTRALVLRLGSKRFGAPDAQSQVALEAVTTLEALERLADRLLEVENWQDLMADRPW